VTAPETPVPPNPGAETTAYCYAQPLTKSSPVNTGHQPANEKALEDRANSYFG